MRRNFLFLSILVLVVFTTYFSLQSLGQMAWSSSLRHDANTEIVDIDYSAMSSNDGVPPHTNEKTKTEKKNTDLSKSEKTEPKKVNNDHSNAEKTKTNQADTKLTATDDKKVSEKSNAGQDDTEGKTTKTATDDKKVSEKSNTGQDDTEGKTTKTASDDKNAEESNTDKADSENKTSEEANAEEVLEEPPFELADEEDPKVVLKRLKGAEWCEAFMVLRKIQAPEKQNPISRWKKANWGTSDFGERPLWSTNDCEKHLGLYKPNVLQPNETLPDEIYEPRVSLEEEELMEYMARTTIQYLVDQNITFMLAFGTLLAAQRHGLLSLPWDDDLDLIMFGSAKEIKAKFAKYPFSHTGAHCKPGSRGCSHYWLPDNKLKVAIKGHGMPFKISQGDKTFPAVDINTFSIINGTAITPKHELVYGHLHKYEKKVEWLYPIQWKEIRYSPRINRTLVVPFPADPESVIKDDYGPDALEQCMTSFTHRQFCKNRNCENPMANHLAKFKFPCSMLRDVFHSPVLSADPLESSE